MLISEQLEATRTAEDPGGALYAIAKRLRDVGLPQEQVYGFFSDYFCRCQDDGMSEEFIDHITDVLDSIYNLRGEPGLFDAALTDRRVTRVHASLERLTDSGRAWRLSIEHPGFAMAFEIENPAAAERLVAFLARYRADEPQEEMVLGRIGSMRVTVLRERAERVGFAIRGESAGGCFSCEVATPLVGQLIGAIRKAVDARRDE